MSWAIITADPDLSREDSEIGRFGLSANGKKKKKKGGSTPEPWFHFNIPSPSAATTSATLGIQHSAISLTSRQHHRSSVYHFIPSFHYQFNSIFIYHELCCAETAQVLTSSLLLFNSILSIQFFQFNSFNSIQFNSIQFNSIHSIQFNSERLLTSIQMGFGE